MLSATRNREFECEKFERMFRMPEHVPESEWKAFITDPRTLELLTKPMKELFPEGQSSTAENRLQTAKITRFDFEEADFNTEQMEYIKAMALRTRLDPVFVFQVVNETISRLPETRFASFARTFSGEAVEEAVVKRWLDCKLSFLRGLIFFTAKVNSAIFATSDAAKVVDSSLKNNALIRARLADLREQNTEAPSKYSSFELNSAAQVNLLKQKELVFRVLHNVFYLLGLDKERRSLAQELVGLLGTDVFDGGINATLKATKLRFQGLTEGTVQIIDRTAVTVYMLFISIFVGPFKTSRGDGPSEAEVELNFQTLKDINGNIKALEGGIVSNLIVREIYQVFVLATAYLSKSPATRKEADTICSENTKMTDDDPALIFLNMADILKRTFPKNGGLHFRWSLKDFLNCLSLVALSDAGESNPYFSSEQDFHLMFIKVLKEVLKSRNILAQFWTEFARKEHYVDVVKGIFASYPLYTQSFLRLATALVGHNNIESAVNLKNELFNLGYLTLPKEDELSRKLETVIVRNGSQQVKLTEDYVWDSNIVIPKDRVGTSVTRQEGSLRFEFDLNFIAHLYRTLLGLSYRPVDAFSDDQISLLVFFCRLVEANPSLILEIHEDVVVKRVTAESSGGARCEYPVTIILLLLDLARVVGLNEQDPVIHVHIFRALASILGSASYEAASFLIKATGMLRDQGSNLDGIFLEFTECFYTAGQNATDPKLRKQYYQGMEAMLAIIRMLMANERSILENLSLLDGNAVAGEQSGAPGQLTQDYQMLMASLASFSLERTEAEVCHFFCKAMMESKAILPFNFEFYFRNILGRVGAAFAREEFLSSEEDLEHVYSFYSEYLALLTVFASKIRFETPAKTIETAKRPDHTRALVQKFKEILNSLPVVDILKKVLNVVENSARPQGFYADMRIRLPLINSHLYNVENNAFMESKGDVVQRFLVHALEWFAQLTDLCRESARRPEDPLYAAFASLFRTSFVSRDGFLAGEVQIRGLMYQVNFIVGLFMVTVNALDYAEMPKLQAAVDQMWFAYNNNCVHWPESLEPQRSADDALFFDDKQFQSTGLHVASNYRKHYFVSTAGFAALTSLLKYWRTLSGVKVPVLVDFLDSSSFDVPNKELFVRVFALEISNQIREKNLEALEFLVECNRSQPEFVAELLKQLDDRQNKTNHLIRSLKALVQESLKRIEKNAVSPFEQSLNLSLICNGALAVFSLLENPRLRKVHLDSIWNGLFVDVHELLVKVQEVLKNPFLDLTAAAQAFKRDNNLFLVLNTPSRAMSLIRLRKLLDESRLVDRTLRGLLQVVANSIFLVLQGNRDAFVTDFSQDFFRKFFSNFNPILRLSLSGELFTLNETLFALEKGLAAFVGRLSPQPQFQWQQSTNHFVSTSAGLKIAEFKERVAMAPRTFDKPPAKALEKPPRKPEYNPLLVYLNLSMAKCDDQVSFAVSDFAVLINTASDALHSKHTLQNAYYEFLRLVLSVGVKGAFFGQKMVLIPGPDSVGGMVKHLNDSLQPQAIQALPVKHQWLTADVYANLHQATDLSGLQEVNLGLPFLRAPEVPLLNPLQADKYLLPFNYFTYFYVKGNQAAANLAPEVAAIDDLFSKISQLCKLSDSLHLQIDTQEPDQDLYLGDAVTFRALIRLLHLFLQAANHLLVSFPGLKNQDTLSPSQKAYELSKTVHDLSTHVSEIGRIGSDRFPSHAMDDLLQSFYLFTRLIGLQDQLPDTERYWKAFVQLPTLELRRHLSTLAYMAGSSSSLLNTTDINYISKVVTLKEATAEDIVSVLQIFGEDYFNNPVKIEVYANSDFLDCLCTVPLLDLSEDFGRGVFYKEGRTTPSHAVFVHMLSLLANLTVAGKDVALLQTKAVGFLAKYRQRIEQILGLWSWGYGAQIGLSGFPQEVYTFAFLEELQATLAFLRALSLNPNTLNGPSEQLFHRAYSQLTTQTLRFISTEIYGQTARLKIGTVSRIFDLFKPVSLLEESLNRIALKESVSYQSLRSGGSLQRPEADPKASVTSQNQSPHQFNLMTTHAGASSSLLNFMVEVKLLEIIFVAADLFRTLTFHSQTNNWKSQVTSRERTSGFYVTLSSVFYDSQVYLKNYLAKMSLKDYYLEGVWHLMILKRSEATAQDTLGLFQLQPVYSYQEVKNIVRRAFELTVYSQRMCIKCFESPLLRGTAEEIAMIRKGQDESQKVIAEFLRYENFGGNPKQSVNLNRSRREGSMHQDPLRSLNPKQHLMSQNLSIRTDVNQSTGPEADESHFFELHKKCIDKFAVGHKWKS